MSPFTLIPIESINSRERFFELVIDSVRCYDDFIKSLPISETKKVFVLYKYMELVGSGHKLPDTKMRHIVGSRDAYEFKKDNIRLYRFKYENLYWIMAHGGYKATQKRDISIIQDLEAQCLERGFNDGN